MTSVISPSRYRTSHIKWVSAMIADWLAGVGCAMDVDSTVWQLCYLFARCTRAVNVPAPVYYAQIAGESSWSGLGAFWWAVCWQLNVQGCMMGKTWRMTQHRNLPWPQTQAWKQMPGCCEPARVLQWTWLLIVCRMVPIPSRLCGRLFYLWLCHKPQYSIQILGNCKIEEHNHVRTLFLQVECITTSIAWTNQVI